MKSRSSSTQQFLSPITCMLYLRRHGCHLLRRSSDTNSLLPRSPILCFGYAPHFTTQKKRSSSKHHAEPFQTYTEAPNYREYRNIGFAAERLDEIVDANNFEHWPQFRILAEKARNQLKPTSPDQHHILSERFTVDYEFEEHVPKGSIVNDCCSQ